MINDCEYDNKLYDIVLEQKKILRTLGYAKLASVLSRPKFKSR